MPKPPRYHLGGVRREQWIANRIKLLSTRIQKDAQELRELDPPNFARVLLLSSEDHDFLLSQLHQVDDQLDGEMDIFAADKDQTNFNEVKEQSQRLNELLGRIS